MTLADSGGSKGSGRRFPHFQSLASRFSSSGAGANRLFLHRATALALAIAGLFSLGYAAARFADSELDPVRQKTAAAQSLLDVGDGLAADIARAVGPAMERTRLLAAKPEILTALQSGDAEELTRLCNAAIRDATEIDAVALFDATGAIKAINTIYSNGTPIEARRIQRVMGENYTAVDVIRNCVNNDSRTEALEFQTSCEITPAFFDSSGLSVAHSAPVFDRASGKQAGVVSVRMRFERIAALASQRTFAGGRGTLYFVTDAGNFFDEAINSGARRPPFEPRELASLVAPLLTANARYTVVERTGQYIGLFRMRDFKTITGGGIQILLAIDSAWVEREADLARIVSAGIPAGFGLLLLASSGLVSAMGVNRQRSLALAGSEERLRALVNNVPGISYRCYYDSRWTMIFISDAVESVTGYPASDFLDHAVRNFDSLIYPDDRASVASSVSGALAQKKSYEIRYRITHADGGTRWLHEKGQGVFARAEDAEPLYLDGVIFDRTAQVKAEEMLADERMRLTAFVRHAPAAVAMFDREMRYMAVSERWLADYGLKDQDLYGKCHYDLFPDCPQRWKDIHARCLAGAVEQGDNDASRPDGGEHDIIIRWEIRPWYDRTDTVAGIMMFSQDITADRRMEAALEEKNASLSATMLKLEEARLAANAANQSKSEFLANMSHEIRTPLTAILGYTDILHDDGLIEIAPARRIEAIATIRRAGDHLLSIINDILDLSKIEAGKLTIESIETPLAEVLSDIGSLMHLRAAEKGVELRIVLETSVPDRILSDPTRLRQILMNLVGNAAKFTDRGSIEVRVREIGRNGSARLRFDIDDTGPGMTQEQVAALFDPFMQADSSVTRKHGGTGLGLVISRRLGSLLGGEVWLDHTAPGKGSRFAFELPLIPFAGAVPVSDLANYEKSNAEKLAIEESAAPMDCRILVAEDNAVNQRLVCFHLKKAGARVDVSDNGLIALAMLEAAEASGNPYDILLTDMQMPEMDGYTLARTLRGQGNQIPILALTAHAMAEDRTKCMEAGCNDYITKPIDKRALLSACRRWAGSAAE